MPKPSGKPTVAVKRPILEFPRSQGINGSDSQVEGFAVTYVSGAKGQLWVQQVTNRVTT